MCAVIIVILQYFTLEVVNSMQYNYVHSNGKKNPNKFLKLYVQQLLMISVGTSVSLVFDTDTDVATRYIFFSFFC